MIALQEELDWQIYHRYGLLEESLTLPGDDVPSLRQGERAFEISWLAPGNRVISRRSGSSATSLRREQPFRNTGRRLTGLSFSGALTP